MSKKIPIRVFALLLAIGGFACLPALDFSFRARPFVFIPVGENADAHEVGYGGDLMFDVDLSSIFGTLFGIGYSAGIEGGMNIAPQKGGAGDNLQLTSVGFGLGLFYYPLSRLGVQGDGAFGFYKGVLGQGSESSYWWRIGAGAGFRFTPSFNLLASGGYRSYNDKYSGGPLHSGIYAGLTAQFIIETGASAASVDIAVHQVEPLTPVFLSLYQQNPAAILTIINNESAEIRNVRISFRAENYTASELLCGTADIIQKRQRVELPLLADFSPQALNLTENSRIVGEVITRYEILGKSRTAVRSAAVSIYNRNTFRWMDSTGLAAFVSPTAPETLALAKRLTGLARTRLRPGINRDLQFGMYLFEGLPAAGIGYSETVPTAYADFRSNAEKLDSIQFPFQTLAYRVGDLDDLGLVYAALLEASGIRAALIPLENDFIVALSPGLTEKGAEAHFNGNNNLLIIDDEVWVPLSIASISKGFAGSWAEAIKKLDAAFVSGENVEFIIVEDAWAIYPPADLPPQSLPPALPVEADVVKAADAAVKAYITTEIEPRIQAVNAQIRVNGTASLYNQAGLLYLRAGSNAQARTNFERAAGMNSTAAMLNLGNLAIVENDITTAERWFNRVLQLDPNNAAAKRGLDQAALDKR
jgi:hypothetical protein